MFFTDIEKWKQSKLRLFCLIFNGIYFLFTVAIPIIIVGCRYQIFTSDKVRLTGWGWVIAIFITVVGLRVVNKLVNKLPDIKKKQQILKYTILGIRALFIPVVIIIAMVLLKNEKFIKYFKALSNNHFFVSPPEMIATNKQNEQSKKDENKNTKSGLTENQKIDKKEKEKTNLVPSNKNSFSNGEIFQEIL